VSEPAVVGGAALIAAVALLWLGRRDVTRPAVAFGVPWFGAVALAQLRLTEIEEPWSAGFALVALGGGLAFVVAATAAGGTAPARGAVDIDRGALRVRRLTGAALVLVAAGIAGAAYKAHVLDGIPLFSANPDAVRARAMQTGTVTVPTWSTALTDGFFLGGWCALAALWALRRPAPRGRVLALWLLVLIALLGVSLEASRNVLVFALAVPAIVAYVLLPPRRRAAAVTWAAAIAAIVGIAIGGLFVLRVERSSGVAQGYLEREMERQPGVLKPLLPVYVNLAFPLEAARRVHDAVPLVRPYGLGGNSLTSLPDRLFPEGKPAYGAGVAELMDSEREVELTWAVASYQGRLLADLGWQGVLLGSALLGLAFGSLYRWARRSSGSLALGLIAYLAYYAAFMVYDNQLSFTLIGIFDLAVIALVGAYATGRIRP
jgi:hypothetical protein